MLAAGLLMGGMREAESSAEGTRGSAGQPHVYPEAAFTCDRVAALVNSNPLDAALHKLGASCLRGAHECCSQLLRMHLSCGAFLCHLLVSQQVSVPIWQGQLPCPACVRAQSAQIRGRCIVIGCQAGQQRVQKTVPTHAKSHKIYLDFLDIAIKPLGTILSRICLSPACKELHLSEPDAACIYLSTATLTSQTIASTL